VRKIIKPESGIYILEIFASNNFSILHKKFSNITFPKGWYYYFGSAQQNLSSRIQRHLAKEKKLFWHIDYITTLNTNVIKNIFIVERKEKMYECILTNTIVDELNLESKAIGFGNSDCTSCKSHLLYSKQNMDRKIFSHIPYAKSYNFPK
jgi:Uri superfamily endonuclease